MTRTCDKGNTRVIGNTEEKEKQGLCKDHKAAKFDLMVKGWAPKVPPAELVEKDPSARGTQAEDDETTT